MNNIGIRFDSTVGGFLKRKKRLREFIAAEGTESYVYERFADGAARLKRVQEASEVGKLHSKGAQTRMLVRVATTDFEGTLLYHGLKDSAGTEMDLELRGSWKVTDCREFLNGYALERLSSSAAVNPLGLERALSESFRTAVNDELRSQAYGDLVSKDVLPKSWWETKLRQWAGVAGLELLRVDQVSYESATVDRQKELEKQQELNELETARDAREKEHELESQERAAAFEEGKKELEANRELAEEMREQSLRELRHKADLAEIAAQQELERSRLEFEKEKAEKESEIYRIRNQLPEAEAILEEARRREAQADELLQKLVKAVEDLSFRAAGGVLSPWTLELLERVKPHDRLSQVFLENQAEYASISLEMIELCTRDIGPRKAKTLTINSALNFEFVSQVPGYAMVINIGTSRKVSLHSPSIYVGSDGCRIEAGRKYEVPRDLVPGLGENGLNYIESGPPGWEEMVVVVSDEPLVRDSDIEGSEPEAPFVLIDAEDWVERLGALQPGSWRSGTLGFKVLAR